MPEAKFAPDGRLRPWLAELLLAARNGKLSSFSSVRTQQVGQRLLAQVGGIWFDTALTTDHRVVVVGRRTAAHDQLVTAAPATARTLELRPCAVLAVADNLAVALDAEGISARDHADIKAILTKVKE
jgi:hypothetical protein